MLFKGEHDYVDESVPLESPRANQPREKSRSSGVRMKGHLASSVEVACSKTSKPGNSSVFHGSSVPEENQDSHQSTTKSRKKQKMPVQKVRKGYCLLIIINYSHIFYGTNFTQYILAE